MGAACGLGWAVLDASSVDSFHAGYVRAEGGLFAKVLHLGTIKSRSLVFAGLNMQYVYIHMHRFLPEQIINAVIVE